MWLYLPEDARIASDGHERRYVSGWSKVAGFFAVLIVENMAFVFSSVAVCGISGGPWYMKG